MTSFTFTSEDLERVNKNKKRDDKIFPITENFRNAPGVKTEAQLNYTFVGDNTRSATVAFKDATGTVQELIGAEFNNNDTSKPLMDRVAKFKDTHGLSGQQITDFKILSSQATIPSGNILPYATTKIDLDKAVNIVNHDDGMPAQFEINKAGHLICVTTAKITFDKPRQQGNHEGYKFSNYPKGVADDIKSSDYMIVTTKVDLGKAGDTKYKPITTCHMHAEGAHAEQLLKDMQKDIVVVSAETKQKTSESIKEEHYKLQSEIFEVTGARKRYEESVKKDIDIFISGVGTPTGRIEMLRELNSTPKLFAEVLVERISELNKIENHEERAQKIKQLSDNAAKFVDQPKGYMKILVNDTAKEMAKEQNINLPKEGIISKISHNIGLMLARINVRIQGKSSDLKEQKQLIHAARTRDKQGIGR